MTPDAAGTLFWGPVRLELRSFTVLFMLIRNSFAKRAGDLGDEFLYSLDWFTIMLFGIMMAFIGKIVRRAVKIKEENDLTI